MVGTGIDTDDAMAVRRSRTARTGQRPARSGHAWQSGSRSATEARVVGTVEHRLLMCPTQTLICGY
jgi:hypothetical protein